jgi:hypothetical protein
LGSAPWFTSQVASLKWPFSIASTSADVRTTPVSSGLNAGARLVANPIGMFSAGSPDGAVSFTSAPAATSSSTDPTLPARTAISSGL